MIQYLRIKSLGLTYLVRSEKDKTEQFIKNTIGKYIDEITIPKCDIEEDMEDE